MFDASGFDRSAFWSAPPDWQQARVAGDRLQLAVVELPAVWRLSGAGTQSLLNELGIRHVVGPREPSDTANYALRIAPQSVLLVCEASVGATLDHLGDRDGVVRSELSDGYLGIEVAGRDAPMLMQLASEYPFTDTTDRPAESARMLFAGLQVALMRRGDGWRLHVERPWGAALWRWLVEHVECIGKGGLT